MASSDCVTAGASASAGRGLSESRAWGARPLNARRRLFAGPGGSGSADEFEGSRGDGFFGGQDMAGGLAERDESVFRRYAADLDVLSTSLDDGCDDRLAGAATAAAFI